MSERTMDIDEGTVTISLGRHKQLESTEVTLNDILKDERIRVAFKDNYRGGYYYFPKDDEIGKEMETLRSDVDSLSKKLFELRDAMPMENKIKWYHTLWK